MATRTPLIALALGTALFATGCDISTEQDSGPLIARSTFFENLEGWTPRAIDVIVGGNDEIEWSVERTTEFFLVAPASVRFSADNRTDAARLWIEQAVQMEPNTDYEVTLVYGFATSDFSDVNNWRIMAGALPTRPTTAADFSSIDRDDTRAGDGAGDTHVWQVRGYESIVRTGADGLFYLVVGVWGTSEFERTYYVDDVNIRIQRR